MLTEFWKLHTLKLHWKLRLLSSFKKCMIKLRVAQAGVYPGHYFVKLRFSWFFNHENKILQILCLKVRLDRIQRKEEVLSSIICKGVNSRCFVWQNVFVVRSKNNFVTVELIYAEFHGIISRIHIFIPYSRLVFHFPQHRRPVRQPSGFDSVPCRHFSLCLPISMT